MLMRPATAARLTSALSQWADRVRPRSALQRRMLWVTAVTIFVFATAAAWRALPTMPRYFQVWWALAAFALALVGILFNAAEYALSSRIVGHDVSSGAAVRISTLGSAANVLPIPGAALVRAKGLTQAGASPSTAVSVTAAMGFAWVGAAAAVAGALTLYRGHATAWGLLFLLAAALGALAWVVLVSFARSAAPPLRLAAATLVLECVSVLASGTRLYAIARAADLPVRFAEATAINLGGIISSAIGIFPGGLGIREVGSGLFGALIGAEPSVGVMMAALDRINIYFMLICVTAVLWLIDRSPPATKISAS